MKPCDLPATADALIAEGLLPLSALARLLPATRGRKVHTSTLLRWVLHGKRGVRLEAVRGPSKTWMSSRKALGRFLAALTALERGEVPAPTPGEDERRRRAEAALKRIRAMKG